MITAVKQQNGTYILDLYDWNALEKILSVFTQGGSWFLPSKTPEAHTLSSCLTEENGRQRLGPLPSVNLPTVHSIPSPSDCTL